MFISNSLDIYLKVTGENDTYYICGNTLYSKEDVVVNYHPLDDMEGKLHLHVVPFYN
jgi:hypothetical protein